MSQTPLSPMAPVPPASSDSPVSPASPVSRRRLFAGAGTAGALAAVATVLPLQKQAVVATGTALQPAADANGGYQLTAHVQRYYQTARV